MNVELLYFDGCPNWTVVEQRLRELLEASGTGVAVERRRIGTDAEAQATGFRGSPTILVDGVDPFATGDDPHGLSCRVYETPDGLAGAPTLEQLKQALGLARIVQ